MSPLRALLAVAALAVSAAVLAVPPAPPTELGPPGLLKPTTADQATLATLPYDGAKWQQYKQAKLAVLQGGMQSPFIRAMQRQSRPEQLYAAIINLERFYTDAALKAALAKHGLTPRTMAIWDKGMMHYAMAAQMMKAMAPGKLPPANSASVHDRNLRFLMERMPEVQAFMDQQEALSGVDQQS